MKRIKLSGRSISFVVAALLINICATAQQSDKINIGGNPIIKNKYTADPSTFVYKDSVYLYTGHDEAPIGKEGYTMHEWLCFSSTDMVNWKEHPVPLTVKDFKWAKADAWASQVIERNGKFYWYVATEHATIPGKAIGVAVADNPTGPFKDARGSALITNDMTSKESKMRIKLVKLNNDLSSVAQPEQWYTVASRKRDFILPDSVAGDAAIEAPFIYKHENYYYLFVSFDYCCRGEKSTYKMMVGRSEKNYGPYVDRDGIPMNLGGGSLLMEGNKNYYGVGHNAVASFNGSDYLVYHAYDANDNGKSKLQIKKIVWFNEWPVIAKRPE